MRVLMPGSYDPCTVGHLAVIEQAAALYGDVTVAVFINPEKKGLFSYDERVEFLRLATAHMATVKVVFSDGMVADYAREGGFDAIVKGVRNDADRRYEEAMAEYNLRRGGVPTILLDAPDALAEVSSTAVRQALAAGDEPEGLLPAPAAAAIHKAFLEKHS